MNSRIQKIVHKGVEIIKVDYSRCKEKEMIDLTVEHRDMVLSEAKVSYFLADYSFTFGTRDYMKAAKDFTETTQHLVKKGAFLGVTGPKVFLLKGITFFFEVNFRAFDSESEALDWLAQ